MSAFGLFNVHKPAGVTSRRAVDRIKKLVRRAKLGHAGTLDPLAEGVLVIAIGKATRLVPRIQEMSKQYRGRFRLGFSSATDDIESDLVPCPDAADVSADEIRAVLPEFVGSIRQVPPNYSAVHVGGRRAYKLARKGVEIELEPKTIEIHRLELVSCDGDEMGLLIDCGSGTYVRSLGRDIGQRLGTAAVMTALTREAIGSFTLADATPLEEMTSTTWKQHLLPAVRAVADWPTYTCAAEEIEEIRRGRPVAMRETDWSDQQRIALLTPTGELAALGVALAAESILKPMSVFLRQPGSTPQAQQGRDRPRNS